MNVRITLADDPNHMCKHILPIMECRLNHTVLKTLIIFKFERLIQFRTAEMTEITLMSFCRQIILDQIVLQKSDIVTAFAWADLGTILEKPERKKNRKNRHFLDYGSTLVLTINVSSVLLRFFIPSLIHSITVHCVLIFFFLESIQDLYSKAHFNMTLTSVFHFKARTICQISQLNEEQDLLLSLAKLRTFTRNQVFH